MIIVQLGNQNKIISKMIKLCVVVTRETKVKMDIILQICEDKRIRQNKNMAVTMIR